MAVSINSVMAAGNQGDTQSASATTSFSVAGPITIGSIASSVLLVCMNWGQIAGNGTTQPGARAVTWNGVSMTEVPGSFQVTTVDPFVACSWFYLINPATGAQTLAASWTGSLDCYASAICFDGVEQNSGTLAASFNVAIGSALTLNVTGTATGATVATHIRNGSFPTSSGVGSLFWDFDSLNPGGGGARALGIAGTNAYDFNSGTNTGTVRATSGLHLVAAATAVDGMRPPQIDMLPFGWRPF